MAQAGEQRREWDDIFSYLTCEFSQGKQIVLSANYRPGTMSVLEIPRWRLEACT